LKFILDFIAVFDFLDLKSSRQPYKGGEKGLTKFRLRQYEWREVLSLTKTRHLKKIQFLRRCQAIFQKLLNDSQAGLFLSMWYKEHFFRQKNQPS